MPRLASGYQIALHGAPSHPCEAIIKSNKKKAYQVSYHAVICILLKRKRIDSGLIGRIEHRRTKISEQI
jgi:hypothetical protein